MVLKVWPVRVLPPPAPDQSQFFSHVADLLPVAVVEIGRSQVAGVINDRDIEGSAEVMPAISGRSVGHDWAGSAPALSVDLGLLIQRPLGLGDAQDDLVLLGALKEIER